MLGRLCPRGREPHCQPQPQGCPTRDGIQAHRPSKHIMQPPRTELRPQSRQGWPQAHNTGMSHSSDPRIPLVSLAPSLPRAAQHPPAQPHCLSAPCIFSPPRTSSCSLTGRPSNLRASAKPRALSTPHLRHRTEGARRLGGVGGAVWAARRSTAHTEAGRPGQAPAIGSHLGRARRADSGARAGGRGATGTATAQPSAVPAPTSTPTAPRHAAGRLRRGGGGREGRRRGGRTAGTRLWRAGGHRASAAEPGAPGRRRSPRCDASSGAPAALPGSGAAPDPSRPLPPPAVPAAPRPARNRPRTSRRSRTAATGRLGQRPKPRRASGGGRGEGEGGGPRSYRAPARSSAARPPAPPPGAGPGAGSEEQGPPSAAARGRGGAGRGAPCGPLGAVVPPGAASTPPDSGGAAGRAFPRPPLRSHLRSRWRRRPRARGGAGRGGAPRGGKRRRRRRGCPTALWRNG